METSFQPYEGTESYIFVSYAHKDSEQVRPLLEALNRAGYRVWYDKGIKTGSKWRDYIADHIENCYVFIPLLSHTFVERSECQDEVDHAKRKGKSIIPIYLEDVTLISGLEMGLGSIQSCKLSDYQGNADKLVESLPRITNVDVEATRRTKLSDIRRIEQYLSDIASRIEQYFNNIDWEHYINEIGQFIKNIHNADWRDILIPIIFVGVPSALPFVSMFFAQNMYTTAFFVFLVILVCFFPVWLSRPKGKIFVRIGREKETASFNIQNGCKSVESYACAGHTELKSVVIPDSVTQIGNGVFQKCSGLSYVGISKNIKKISKQTFYACASLTKVTIPEGVEEIGVSAFSFCENLNSVSIPDSVKQIDNNAFHNCPNLRSTSVPAHADISPTAFDSTTQVIRR